MTGEIENPIRVAVVEDKASFRKGLAAVFELTEWIKPAGLFATGEEAIREIPKTTPDVVLMDVNLPGISGIECTREVRRLRPASQVVMLTIEEDSEKVFQALRAGAIGYLLKNATPGDILDAIQLVARGGSPMSAIIARRIVESYHGAAIPIAEKVALSKREIEVLEEIARGKRIKEVAQELNVSPTTVQTYLRRIYEKLQVRSQAEAVAKYLR